MSTTEKTNEAALITLPDMNLPVPSEVAAKIGEAFKTIYTKIEAEIDAFEPDTSTKAGRERIASLAYKISRTKTGLDDAAAALTAGQKAIIDAVNAERRTNKETLDELRDKARAPLNKWEEYEAERTAHIAQVVKNLENVEQLEYEGIKFHELNQPQLAQLRDKILNAKHDPEYYKEHLDRVQFEKSRVIDLIDRTILNVEKREKEQAELEELRSLKAKQEEAERLRIEDEQAKKQAEDDLKKQKAEKERLSQEAKEQAEKEAQAKIDEANQRAIQAKIDADAEAERKIQAAKDEANRAERQREDDRAKELAEKAAEQAASENRAADINHRKKINKAALSAIIKASEVSEDQGKMIVAAISRGQIPHILIQY